MSQWIRHPEVVLNGGMRPDLLAASERIPLGWFEQLVNLHHANDIYLTKRWGIEAWEDTLSLATIAYGVFSVYKPTGERYRFVFDVNASATRLNYLNVGGSWSSIASFFTTPYRQVRGVRLKGNIYVTNGAENLRYFKDSSEYGDVGVWPPTSTPECDHGDDPSTDATDDTNEAIGDSGFLQYCVTFEYQDAILDTVYHESPPSARTGLVNIHWGDLALTAQNVHYGYMRRGVPLTIPTNADISSLLRDRIGRRKIYRRWKKYADQPWGNWMQVTELYSSLKDSWSDSVAEDDLIALASPHLPAGDNNVPPIGKLIAASGNRLFLANLKDRLARQPSLSTGWRGTLTDSVYEWIASGHGANEYYVRLVATGDDPGLTDPTVFYLNGTAATEGTLGALNDHEWGYGDNDTLGYSTVYFADATGDPDGSGVALTIDGYTPDWPYRMRVDITDTCGKVVTRGMVEMMFTVNAGDIDSKDPDAAGVGAYLPGMSGVDFTDESVYRQFCFTADDGITEIGYEYQNSAVNTVTFLVEIPELYGATSIYVYYGDSNARAMLSNQWESVFHKLLPQSDMIFLCNADVYTPGVDTYGIDRICGRYISAPAWPGSDGGVVDDDADQIFSSGDEMYVTARTNHIDVAPGDTPGTDVDEGTVQFLVWIDYSELNNAQDNVIFHIRGQITNYFLNITWDGAKWEISFENPVDGVIAAKTDLTDLDDDMWLWVSLSWSVDGGRIYVDSPDFTGGPITYTYTNAADSQDLPNLRPYDNFYFGHLTPDRSVKGYYDEMVIWNRSITSTDELAAQYLRRTYWENDLDMQTADEEDLSERTERPYRITWSDLSAPDIFQTDEFRDSDTGAEVTSIMPFGGNVLVLYQNEVRVLRTGAPAQAAIFGESITETWELSGDITGEIRGLGSIAPDATKDAGLFVLFYGMRGLYAYNGSFMHVSKALDGILKDIPLAWRRAITGEIYAPDNQYWMAVPSGANYATEISQLNEDADEPFGKAAANEVRIAQSFTPQNPLLRAVFFEKVADTGTFTGTVTVSIQAEDVNGEPGGIDLVSHTFTNAEWADVPVGENQRVDLPCYLDIGNIYFIVFRASTSSDANHPNIRYNTAGDQYTGGALFEFDGTQWTEVTGDDLKFATSYVYHDRVFVLDLKSVGPDPETVRWTEFRWTNTDYLIMRGFSALDDTGDSGELVLLDADGANLYKYPNDNHQDDGDDMLARARTGKIDLRDTAVRRVWTNFNLDDASGNPQTALDVYIPSYAEVLVTLTDITDGDEEWLPIGSNFAMLRFEWWDNSEYAFDLRSYGFEYRLWEGKLLKDNPDAPVDSFIITFNPYMSMFDAFAGLPFTPVTLTFDDDAEEVTVWLGVSGHQPAGKEVTTGADVYEGLEQAAIEFEHETGVATSIL